MSTQPTAPATPRTDHECDDYAGPLCWIGGTQFIPADFARTLETELTAAQAALAAAKAEITKYKELADFAETQRIKLDADNAQLRAEVERLKADNESLRTLWTEIRTVLIQSRAANCVCSYGAQQADAVEAANAVLKRMPPDVTTERDQLRARVGGLERALEFIEENAGGTIETEVGLLRCNLPWVAEQCRAARAGKGAT